MKKVILFLLFISGLTYSQTSLGGVSILNSYGGLLHFGNNTGLKTSLQTVYDGLGNVSALQLATDSVNIVGTFTINGVGAGSGTISSIIFGNGLTGGTITSTGTVTVDTTVIANKTFLTNQYQPKGLYLIPSDSTANRTFSDLKYQVKATYLIPSDSTANRTYSNSLYQAKATYLIPSDSTANRTFSNAKYQAAGTYLTSETDPIFVADSNLFNSKTLTTAQLATKVNYSDSTTTFYTPTQAKSKMSYSDTTSLIATKWYEATLIPTQTGNAGLFLTTNGTNTSWATVPGGGDMLKSAYATQSGAAVDSSRFAESSNWSNIISKPTFGSMSLVDSTTYHGSASITTLGTVTTGAWHSVSVDTAYSTAKVISVAGRAGSVTLSTTDISGLSSMAKADSTTFHGSASIVLLGTVPSPIFTKKMTADTVTANYDISTSTRIYANPDSATTHTIDASSGNEFSFRLTKNDTVNVTNMVEGQNITVQIANDSTWTCLLYCSGSATAIKWKGGTAPTFTTGTYAVRHSDFIIIKRLHNQYFCVPSQNF